MIFLFNKTKLITIGFLLLSIGLFFVLVWNLNWNEENATSEKPKDEIIEERRNKESIQEKEKKEDSPKNNEEEFDKEESEAKESDSVKQGDESIEKTEPDSNEETASSEKSPTSKSSKNCSNEPSQAKTVTTTKTTTATEFIPYQTIRQNDPSLEKGKEVVAQLGQNGIKTITYEETYVNGKLSSKEQVASQITKQPVNQIIKVGTKEQKASYISAEEARSILDQNGLFSKSFDGEEYFWLDESGLEPIRIYFYGSHVTMIFWDATPYRARNAELEVYIDALGEKEGRAAYEYNQQVMKTIESVVRCATKAVYGKGTVESKELYNEILRSDDRTFSF